MEREALNSNYIQQQGPVEHQCQCSVDCCSHIYDHGSYSQVPVFGAATQCSTNQPCNYSRAYSDYVQDNRLPPTQYHNSSYINCYAGEQSIHAYGQQFASAPSFLHAPQLSSNVTRVLINPNFRAKSAASNVSDVKTMNVHFNPHWRPKTDPVVHTKGKEVHDIDFAAKSSSLNSVANKKTIHVNPRMLAQMSSNAVTKESVSDCVSKKEQQNSQIQPLSTSSSQNLFSGVMKKYGTHEIAQNQPIGISSKARIEEKVTQEIETAEEKPCTSGLSNLVALSSTKLVRKMETNSAVSKQNLSHHCSLQSKKMTSVEIRQRQSIGSTSVKFAKSVCSKYKFVRSISSSPFITKGVKTQPVVPPPRRRRTNSSGSVIVPGSTLKNSRYKYTKISKTLRRENSTTSRSKYKFVNDTKPPTSEKILTSNCPSNSPVTSTKSSTKTRRLSVSNKVIKSRYKLVRGSSPHLATLVPCKPARNVNSRFKMSHVAHGTLTADVKPFKRSTRFKLIRLSSSSNHCKSPKPIKTRYKLVRIPSAATAEKHLSKYSICCDYSSLKEKSKISFIQQPKLSRFLENLNLNPNRNRISKSGQYFKLYGNRVWCNQQALEPRHVAVTSRSFLRIGFTPRRYRNSDGTTNRTDKRKGRLIDVGGVLYRSTPTTLTRTPHKGETERVVYVRGKKFVLNRDGTTLFQVNDDSAASQGPAPLTIGRLDIGGLTFRRSGSTLVRTNTHKTRNLLSQAKFRSIALLTDKLRKNNQPCLIYQRFGKCGAHEKGKCWRVHDPKKVAICRKFLQGRCEAEKCLLSHNVGPEKMPTCHHFLEGCCVRDNCPYLHVKLSARTAICRNFLDGYCAAADMCKMRHVYICPDFEREGKCGKGKYCPYPHRVKNKDGRKNTCTHNTHKMEMDNQKSKAKAKTEIDSTEESKTNRRTRYYHDKEGKNDSAQAGSVENDVISSFSKKRQRILKQMNLLKKMRQAVIYGEGAEITGDSCEEDVADGSSDVLVVPTVRPKLGILPAYIPLE